MSNTCRTTWFTLFSPYETWIFLTFNLDQKQFWTIFSIQMVVTHPMFDYFRRPSHVGAWPPHVMPVCQRLLDTYMCIASIEMCPFLYKMNSRIISFTFGCFCLVLDWMKAVTKFGSSYYVEKRWQFYNGIGNFKDLWIHIESLEFSIATMLDKAAFICLFQW